MKKIYSFAKFLMALLLMCLPSQVSAQTFEELAGTWTANLGSVGFTDKDNTDLPKSDWDVTITTEEKDGKQMAYMKGFLGTVKLSDGTESAWEAEFKEQTIFGKTSKLLTFKLPAGAVCYTEDGGMYMANNFNPDDAWVVQKSSDGKLTITSGNYVLLNYAKNTRSTSLKCYPITLTRTGDEPTGPTEPTEPTEPKALGEPLTSLDDATLDKTYALYNPVTGSYVSYVAEHSPKMWITGYAGTPDFDATSANSAWMVHKDGDKVYLYNVGNKQYFNTPGYKGVAYACEFASEPVALEFVDNSNGNFAFTADKGDLREGQYVGYANIATQFLNDRPVTIWSSDAEGSQFQLKENPNVEADKDFADKWGTVTPVTPVFTFDPAPGHYDAMPKSFKVSTGVELDPASVVVNYTSSKVDVAELPADQVTVDADSIKFTLPDAAVENASTLTLAIQMKDKQGNVLTNGEDEEYVIANYEADVKSDLFTVLSAEPAADTKVASLKTIKVTMNGAATEDYIGGFDTSKVLNLLAANGDTVTTATIALDEANSNEATVTLADEVKYYGKYTLVIPAATIYNKKYDDIEPDFGVAYGATYNPETRLEFNVRVDNGYTVATSDPADGASVQELSVVKLTMSQVDYPKQYYYIGAFDNNKAIVVKNAQGDTVTTATIYYTNDHVYNNDATITLANKITELGTYTLVIPEGTIYSGAAVYSDYENASYNPETTLTFTVAEPPAPELGDPIASLADATTDQTYVLYNRANDTYAVWDEAHGNKVWAAGANGRYDALDRTAAGSSWMLVEKDGKYYLYNMGGKMYLSTPGWPDQVALACRFAADPVALTAVELGDGKFAFTATGVSKDYMCAAPGAAVANPEDGECPITIWSYDADGCAWELLPNPNVAADPSVVDVVTGISEITTTTAAEGIYTLQGVKLNTNDVKSLSKGLYIVNGKKVLVK